MYICIYVCMYLCMHVLRPTHACVGHNIIPFKISDKCNLAFVMPNGNTNNAFSLSFVKNETLSV